MRRLPVRLLSVLGRILAARSVCVAHSHAAGHVGHAHTDESAHGAHAAFIGGCVADTVGGSVRQNAHTHFRIAHHSAHLYFLQFRFVFFVGLHAVYAEGNYFDAAQVTPLGRQNVIQGVCQFHGAHRQFGIIDALCGNFTECRLQCSQQFGFQLAVPLAPQVLVGSVAGNGGIEQDRVNDLVAVFAKAADTYQQGTSGVLFNNLEGNFRRGAVFVADNFFCVEVVNALILTGIAAEGKTFTHPLEYLDYAFFQVAGKYRRLCGFVIGVFAGFSAQVNYLALFHDHHALANVDRDHGTVGDDVVFPAGIGAAALAAGPFLALAHQHIRCHAVAVKILFPLVGQYAANGAHACFN